MNIKEFVEEEPTDKMLDVTPSFFFKMKEMQKRIDELEINSVDVNTLTECMAKVMVLTAKNVKLKQLLLLTDDAVSDIVVGDTQIKQWNEFIKEFPDEKENKNEYV